jgi:hypothetical protein
MLMRRGDFKASGMRNFPGTDVKNPSPEGRGWDIKRWGAGVRGEEISVP